MHYELGVDYLCLAGGVALNCVGNGRVLREGPFKGIWIQPAAGDAGGALGAALNVWYQYEKKPRAADNVKDKMKGSYLGPAFSNEDVEARLKSLGAVYRRLDEKELYGLVADELAAGKVVGWHQGRMEFGPRSLGGRSILGDARNTNMQSVLNLKIKYRESFRPFAPSVLRERVSDYFQMKCDSPYMLLVAPILEKRRLPFNPGQKELWGIDLLNVPRSDIPSVTHIDYSARVQTVHERRIPGTTSCLRCLRKRRGMQPA